MPLTGVGCLGQAGRVDPDSRCEVLAELNGDDLVMLGELHDDVLLRDQHGGAARRAGNHVFELVPLQVRGEVSGVGGVENPVKGGE